MTMSTTNATAVASSTAATTTTTSATATPAAAAADTYVHTYEDSNNIYKDIDLGRGNAQDRF